MAEELIEQVRLYEFLYNQHLRDYRDQNVRHEAWEKIAKELNSSVKEVKDKWTKLRNCYLNAIRRRNVKQSGQGRKTISLWKYENEMSFLKPYLDTRETQSNLSQMTTEDPLEIENTISEGDEVGEITNKVDDEDSVSTTPLPLPSTERNETTPPTTKRIRHYKNQTNNPAEEMVKIMKENSERRLKREEKKTTENLDDTDMFYLSMSKNVKKLPEIEQINIRMELCRLVSEAQIKHLRSETVVKNEIGVDFLGCYGWICQHKLDVKNKFTLFGCQSLTPDQVQDSKVEEYSVSVVTQRRILFEPSHVNQRRRQFQIPLWLGTTDGPLKVTLLSISIYYTFFYIVSSILKKYDTIYITSC